MSLTKYIPFPSVNQSNWIINCFSNARCSIFLQPTSAAVRTLQITDGIYATEFKATKT